jgi:hypothetical protein
VWPSVFSQPPYVQLSLPHSSSKQINTHPTPLHHVLQVHSPAPLNSAPTKNEALHYNTDLVLQISTTILYITTLLGTKLNQFSVTLSSIFHPKFKLSKSRIYLHFTQRCLSHYKHLMWVIEWVTSWLPWLPMASYLYCHGCNSSWGRETEFLWRNELRVKQWAYTTQLNKMALSERWNKRELLYGSTYKVSRGIKNFVVQLTHTNYKILRWLTFRRRASSIYDRHFATLQRTLFIYLINKYISLFDICLTVHHWYK